MSVPKDVTINLKINNFRMINQQQPRFCVIFFSKINPDAHVSTKMNTFTFYNRSLGAIAPRSQRNVKKWRLFLFFYQMLHTCRIDSPVMMWIQICARGSGGMLPQTFYLSISFYWHDHMRSLCQGVRNLEF